jgi:hypothetical protein
MEKTNDELTNNSQPNIKKDFVYNLPYNKTEWGLFYDSYKEQGQLQLQKALEKNKNELLKSNKMNPYDKIKWVQHIFYLTEWNDKTEEYQTPTILLRQAKHGLTTKCGFFSEEHSKDSAKIREVSAKVFKEYRNRCVAEHKEIKAFYENRKKELEVEQKKAHKEHANENVCCPFCNCQVARTNLARHKKTNKKCLEMQSTGNLEK